METDNLSTKEFTEADQQPIDEAKNYQTNSQILKPNSILS